MGSFIPKVFMMLDKSDLRKKYRECRREQSTDQKYHAENQIIRFFLSHIDYKNKNIALYFAKKEELNVSLLVKHLWKENINVFLPVMNSEEMTLHFAAYRENTVMKENVYGIDEPECVSILSPKELDIVLLPMLAFNRQGQRLGMGKGYYDRTFAFRQNNRIKPLLIGIAYANQESEELIADEWDIPVDVIITENEYYRV